MNNIAINKNDTSTEYDVIIIGAGPAGLAAAVGAHEAGADSILIIDRGKHPGGILQQCIHPGFGLKKFKNYTPKNGLPIEEFNINSFLLEEISRPSGSND